MENVTAQSALASEGTFLDEKQLLTRIPISRRTAFSWVRSGKLPCVKIGRRKLFHWPSVEAALLRQQRNGIEP
jgi:predicted site-specific integrase-resolvase